jgi:hypothetical protein
VPDTLRVMTSHKTPQTMKPATAAKKLGVLLEATPAEFQEGVVSRDELNALQADPRQVVAAKLRVSISGLTRAGITEPLTTEQVEELKAARPDWLQQERATQVTVKNELERLKTAPPAKTEKPRKTTPRRPRS